MVMMFRYPADREDYKPTNRVYERGCTCKSWYEEPCDYCQGDYQCPDGCGYSAGNCQCLPTWEELPEEERTRLIEEAFNELCSRGECASDDLDPAVELAKEWYSHDRLEQ